MKNAEKEEVNNIYWSETEEGSSMSKSDGDRAHKENLFQRMKKPTKPKKFE